MYKFCPLCAGKLARKSYNLLVCSSCGFHFYQNPVVCSGALILNSKNQVLLVKRKYPPYKNYWDVPGGFVEPAENMEEAAGRELREELGFAPAEMKYFASYHSIYPYQKITYRTLCVMYVAKVGKQNIKIGDDVAGYDWFTYNEAKKLKLAFSFIRIALDELKSYQ